MAFSLTVWKMSSKYNAVKYLGAILLTGFLR